MASEQTSNLDRLFAEIDKDGLNRKSFKEFLLAYSYEESMAENILYWLYRYHAIEDDNLEQLRSSPKAMRSLEGLVRACRERIDESFLSSYASGGWLPGYLRSKARHQANAKFEDFARAASGREVIVELAKALPDQGIFDRLADLSHPHDLQEWMKAARDKFFQRIQNGLGPACRKRVFNVRNISDYFLEEYLTDSYRVLRSTLDDDSDILTLLISDFESSIENFEAGAKYEARFAASKSTILDFDVDAIFGGDTIVLERDGLLKAKLSALTSTLARKSSSLKIPGGDYFENVPLRYRTKRGDLLDKAIPAIAIVLLIVSIFFLRPLLPLWFLFIIFFYVLRPFFARRGGFTAVVRRIILWIQGLFRK